MPEQHTHEGTHPPHDKTTDNKAMWEREVETRETSMVPIGLAGCAAAVIYGVRNFRNRPANMSASMYIMRFRVFAQSLAVGGMVSGLLYAVLRDRFDKEPATASHEHEFKRV